MSNERRQIQDLTSACLSAVPGPRFELTKILNVKHLGTPFDFVSLDGLATLIGSQAGSNFAGVFIDGEVDDG